MSLTLSQPQEQYVCRPSWDFLTKSDAAKVYTDLSLTDSEMFNYDRTPNYVIIHNSKKENKTLEPMCITESEKKGAHYTTVKWNDNTFTTVKACKEDADKLSSYMAFCAALAKKLYGSNAAVHRMVDRHMETYLKAEKQKAKDAKHEEHKKHEQEGHNRAVRREV